ncbi:MAG: bifunctional nuclease domain-containing protein [Ardenticatenaceae bacterium]
MEQRADAELVALARKGDKQAFGCLVERHQRVAQRVARRMVRQEDIARELVQEAWLQAYLCLDALRQDASFSSWLYGIVLNVCRSYLRRNKVTLLSWEALVGGLRFEALPFSATAPDPQKIAEERELHQLVSAAVHALSPANRAATLLFYYEQLSVREVATALAISEGAVKGRLYKARKQLRAQLSALLHQESTRTPTPTERKAKMVPVIVADVVAREAKDGQPDAQIVILLDEAGQRALPIWVGPVEADAIVIGAQEPASVEKYIRRPLTYRFTASLLQAVGAELVDVRVDSLKDDIFYGVAKVRHAQTVREVDCRPSDAMALALHMGSPIYVSETVWQTSGIDVSQDEGKVTTQRKGMQELIEALKERMKRFQSWPKRSDEEIAQSQRELMDFVFGN